MDSIITLLDITNKTGSYEQRFHNLCSDLMNKYLLHVNQKQYRLCELEVYYSDNTHNDPFTHKDTHQQTIGKLYFHKYGNEYKSGTYKGLDITIGNSDDGIYGGIFFFLTGLHGLHVIVGTVFLNICYLKILMSKFLFYPYNF